MKKKACTQRDAHFLPLKLPSSAIHQAKIFHPYHTTIWWHQIPEEFSFKAMSPTHKYTTVQPVESVNHALPDRQAR